MFDRRPQNQNKKRDGGRDRQRFEKGAQPRAGARDQHGHAHVLHAAERHHGAEHGEPQEQDRREFVRPGERPAKAVARDHAGKQDHDFDGSEQRDRDFHRAAEDGVDTNEERPRVIKRSVGRRGVLGFHSTPRDMLEHARASGFPSPRASARRGGVRGGGAFAWRTSADLKKKSPPPGSLRSPPSPPLASLAGGGKEQAARAAPHHALVAPGATRVHEIGPVNFSSTAQASSPYLPRHSL
jgi:hypothetical protein